MLDGQNQKNCPSVEKRLTDRSSLEPMNSFNFNNTPILHKVGSASLQRKESDSKDYSNSKFRLPSPNMDSNQPLASKRNQGNSFGIKLFKESEVSDQLECMRKFSKQSGISIGFPGSREQLFSPNMHYWRRDEEKK